MKWMLITLFFMSHLVKAQKLQSFCYTDPTNPSRILGRQIDDRLPIASVSKLVTTLWALSTKGPYFQYHTELYLKPVGQDQYDLHLQGSRDPYFGQEKIHYMISELNRRGISKIRNFSFDENFLYLKDLDVERDPFDESKNSIVWFNWYRQPFTAQRALRELKKGLINEYTITYKKSVERKVSLLPKVAFTVKNFYYKPSQEFAKDSSTQVFSVKSAPLFQLLKEMNRNSNNFAAVEIFNFLGGAQKFQNFLIEKYQLGPDSILFFEGSGNRISTEARYNEASCRALLRLFKALDDVSQSHFLDLDDVISVIGEDGLVNEGTPYNADSTSDMGVAKTGTIDPTISLGGMLNSVPHRLYFMFNVKPSNTSLTAKRAARILIGNELKRIAEIHQSSLKPLEYEKNEFISFDSSGIGFVPIGSLN